MAGLQELTKRLTEDKAFAKAFSQIKTKEELLAKFKEEEVEIAGEDLEKFLKGKEGELSDEELEGAAGGFILKQLFIDSEFIPEFIPEFISNNDKKRFI